MHSPAVAIAWQLLARYRLGVIGGLGYLILAAVGCQAMPESAACRAIRHVLAVLSMGVPIGLVPIFVFGSQIDLASQESTYPSRMLTLPVRTRTLVVWPMLYGALAMAAAVVGIAWFVLQPSGIRVPLGWPPVLMAVCLAWLQAIGWSPFPLGWLRLPLLAVAVGLQVVVVQLGRMAGVPDSIILLALAGQLPIAGWLAVRGVARARRGEIPEWDWMRRNIAEPLRREGSPLRPFRSALQAQVWLEWRLGGWALPLMVGLCVPVLAALVILNRLNPGMARGGFLRSPLAMLCLPVFVGMGIFGQLGRYVAGQKDREPSVFLAARPMSNVAVVAAKFKAAAMSLAAAYLVASLGTIILLVVTGATEETAAGWARISGSSSSLEAALAACIALLLLVVGTWVFSAGNLVVGLTGRMWIPALATAVFVGGFLTIMVSWPWLSLHPEYFAGLREALPYVLWTLVAAKLLLAAGALAALCQRRMLDRIHAFLALLVWLAAAMGLLGVFAWLVPRSAAPWVLLVPSALLAVPLARIALSPLALAWNRHR